MPNDYGSRGRHYSSGRPSFSRSPPRKDPGRNHHSESSSGRRDTKVSSIHERNGDRSPSSNQGSHDHGSHHGSHSHSSNNAKSSGNGRVTTASSSTPARSHFQNLSWTPDKGSRGGVAPSERRLPPRQDSNDKANGDEKPTNQTGSKADGKGTKVLKDNLSRGASPQHGVSSRPEKSLHKSMGKEQHQVERVSDDRGGSSSGSAPAKIPPTKPAVKFEMKVPTAPALARRSNPIQTAPKAPSRPSVFQTAATSSDDRQRRPNPQSPRGKLAPPRFAHARYEDPAPSRRPSHPEDYRHESQSHRSAYADPYPPSSRDRRIHDSRAPDPRHSGPPHLRDARTLKSSKPRRKKFKKVLKKHIRVVLPSRTLPQNFAASDFVYYPRPDRTSVVGAGTYGKVFKAHNVYLNHCVALKTLPLIKPRRKAVPRDHTSRDKKRKRQERWVKDGLHLTSLREIKLLKSISHQHDNVVGIREIFLEGPSCNLVFDYFEFDMHGIIYSAKVALEDSMTKDLVRQVFQGLDFLHTKAHILHRDIKAANILVGANGQVRITDFGLAKHVKSDAELETQPWYKKKFEHSNRVITTPYRSPELLLGATVYGGEVDVWSGGCVLFEAFLKKLPFQGTGEDIDHLLTIWKILGLPNASTYPAVTELEWYWLFITRVQPKKSIFGRLYKDKMTPQLYHLLRCIFQHDPMRRPSAAQILRHPFFTTESPKPQSAGSFLKTVEGEWHELEYKMIRDKEKAASRRKHENNVILGYLKHKQADHEQELSTSIDATDIVTHQERIQFYKTEHESFQQRLDAKVEEIEDDPDHSRQVAEMKKTHGDMYMNAARRGRYRGPSREKVDEKLLQEAWKWYEDENKKGNNPVPALSTENKPSASVVSTPLKSAQQSRSILKDALLGSTTAASTNADRRQSRLDRKLAYETRKSEYALQVTRYQARKSKHVTNQVCNDKRPAASPLVDEPYSKKMRESND